MAENSTVVDLLQVGGGFTAEQVDALRKSFEQYETREFMKARTSDATARASTTTLADDDVFFVDLKADRTYLFEFTLVSNSGATGNLKVAVDVPAHSADQITEEGGTSADIDTGITLTTDGSEQVFRVYATLTTTEKGRATFQWAQGTSNATGAQLLAGSTMRVVDTSIVG